MPRKRKIRVNSNENQPPAPRKPAKGAPAGRKQAVKNKAISAVILLSQDLPSRHDKYVKELQNIYLKCNHDEFMEDFLFILMSMMAMDITNEFISRALNFCAKFIASYNTEETHPIMTGVFKWLLGTTSPDTNIRFRLVEFVNLILKSLGEEAVVDDSICDGILKYMTERIGDVNANTRTQAVLALQRLQEPDDPNDCILKQYFFHLSTDPSVQMRQTIITSIARNMHTIPPIIERLWDVDEKVRRHVILQMSSYAVRSYKVAERLTFLEQGLNDRSEQVRKATTNVMLPRWVTSYNENYIAFVGALKLDTNDKEMQRFRKCALQALQHIFKKADVSKIVTALGFAAPDRSRRCSDDEEEEENETTNDQFPRCVPLKSLNIEVAVYWEAAVGYLQDNDMDQLNIIQPELSIFCQYVEKYCESIRFESDKWQQMKNQYILLSLLEIVSKYNLGDEVGLSNLKNLLSTMVTKYDFNELNIALIARILEAVYPISENRLQVVVEIVNGILQIGDSSSLMLDSEMESAVFKKADIELQLKLSALKVKMMDLKEQENGFVQTKDYASAQKATEEWDQANEEYIRLLHPLIVAEANQSSSSSSTVVSDVNLLKAPQKISSETIMKCLQIIHYSICSEHTKKITPPVVNLYNKFICRHMDSGQVVVREWAFKCATACSMLYSMLAKEVCRTLCSQFVRNHNIRLWTTAIECLFELVDRYGLDFFAEAPSEDDTAVGEKRKARQLFSTSTRGEEDHEEVPQSLVEVLGLLSSLLENCEHNSIVQALVVGFCRFVLHGIYTEPKIVAKLMVYYFNPATEPEVNQVLGIFFEALTNERKQEYLQPALLPTLFFIFEAPVDHPLQEIKPETVIKFVIDVTQPQYCSPGLNIHDTIGMSFINAMQDNVTQKEMLKVLSKGLLLLEVSEDPHFRKDLKNSCDQLLSVVGLDEKVVKNITTFKDLLDGIRRPTLTFSSTRMTSSTGQVERGSDEEVSDEEANNSNREANLEAISEENEEQSSVIEGIESEKAEVVTPEPTEEKETPVPMTETPRSSQSSGSDSSVFLPETQKPTQEVTQSQSSVASNDSEVIEASFDETAVSRRRMRARTDVSVPGTSKDPPSQPKKTTTKSATTSTVTKKRVMEVRTPNARSKITRSATSSQPEKEAAKKQQPEKPSTRTRGNQDKSSSEMSLSQSSSASSVKSGPSTPKRPKSVSVQVTPLSKSFIEKQTNPHRTRRAAAEELAQNTIMTRTRVQHLSPGRSSQRSKSSQETKTSARTSSKTRSASTKK